MSPSRILFFSCLAGIAGIAIASIVDVPRLLAWGFLIAAAPLGMAGAAWSKPRLIAAACILLVLMAGVMRLQAANWSVAHDPLARYRDSPQKVQLSGQIVDAPDVRGASQKLTVKVAGTNSLLLVTTYAYQNYHYLDTVSVTGKLKTPAVFKDFNYQDYLKKDGIYSVMDYPDIQMQSARLSPGPGQLLYAGILEVKNRLASSVRAVFDAPRDSLLLGILLGNNRAMPQDLQQKLDAAGLRYLTAVSGTHVIIVSEILMALLLALGLWRQQACAAAIFLIWMYVAMVGLPASAVRAAVMASMLLAAQALGRQHSGIRALVFACALMLAQNPLLLRLDVGFQLSFLASLGIAYGKPFFNRLLDRALRGRAKAFNDIASVSLAAQLFTAPLMIYNLGSISLVSPLTSLLTAPAVYFIMVFGFIAALMGMAWPWLGWLASAPCGLLLDYFLQVLNWFSKPWALAVVANVPAFWPLAYYGALAIAVWWWHARRIPAFLEY